ncbi:MAG TPA: DUF2799 domain-containing protein [Burkholderiaceae bacterium]|nr:DUF2799 domain-containing protein [Burkholderiaceae bacterium]
MSHKSLLACFTSLIAAVLLSGCATGMSKDECALADWQTIGYEDGLRGFPAERIGTHRVACAKHQVTPNLLAYNTGRERGLREYCQPKNGFRAGLNGTGYANVCSGSTETAFVNAYQWGRQIHDARAELRTTNSRLRSTRESLAHTNAAMASVTAELVLPSVPIERRSWLATELVRLTQERSELIARIDQLSAHAQQLAVNVHELEKQSPYAL